MYEISQREAEKTFRLRYELSRGDIREIRAEFLRQVDFIQTMRLFEEMGLWVRRSKHSSSRFYATTPPSFSRPFSRHTDFSIPLPSDASFRTSPMPHHRHHIQTSPYQNSTSLTSPFASSSSPLGYSTDHASLSPLISTPESLSLLTGQYASSRGPSPLSRKVGEAPFGPQQQMSHQASVRAVNSSPVHPGPPHKSMPGSLHSPDGLPGGHFSRKYWSVDKPLTTSEAPLCRSPIPRPSSLTNMRAMLPPPRKLPFQHSPKKRPGLHATPEDEVGRSGLASAVVTMENLNQQPILSPPTHNPTSAPFMERRLSTSRDVGVHRHDGMRTEVSAFNMREAGPTSAAHPACPQLAATELETTRKADTESREWSRKNEPGIIIEQSFLDSNGAVRSDDRKNKESAPHNKKRQKRTGSPGGAKVQNQLRELESRITAYGPVPDEVKDNWKDLSRLRPRKNAAKTALVSRKQSLGDAGILKTRGIAAQGSRAASGSRLDSPDAINSGGSTSVSRSPKPQQDTKSRDFGVSCNIQDCELDCGTQAIMDMEHTVNLFNADLPCQDHAAHVADATQADEHCVVHLRKHDIATQTISITKDAAIYCSIKKPGIHISSQTDTPTSNADLQTIEDTTTRKTRHSEYDDHALVVGLQLIDEARHLVHERLDGDLDNLERGYEFDMRESTAKMLQSVERLAQENLDNHGPAILNLPFGKMVGNYLKTRQADLTGPAC
ncbi:hypothetical protein SODALDRAFT_335332 [Sodiomyces alkalinus F11]|uniref:Uncharacterized protein n=1 Tax=Sodiomyces alkalinus (strain CBS 110278 / VKM F-3762 / F11) TaxID=1314773 RepID=A0A3N2PP15_SODAK|nr:hypothetical protein SODALDRAFT_335332 [Sodiomyces alkalinus F11]ROT36255.1 hypothetical protein SODALDRAFT_335332 [Sodiomyces alkalinus F11]